MAFQKGTLARGSIKNEVLESRPELGLYCKRKYYSDFYGYVVYDKDNKGICSAGSARGAWLKILAKIENEYI